MILFILIIIGFLLIVWWMVKVSYGGSLESFKYNYRPLKEELKREVLRGQRNQCFIPNCDYNRSFKFHHVMPRWMGGDNSYDNIAALCPNHEAEAHETNKGGLNYRGVPRYMER